MPSVVYSKLRSSLSSSSAEEDGNNNHSHLLPPHSHHIPQNASNGSLSMHLSSRPMSADPSLINIRIGNSTPYLPQPLAATQSQPLPSHEDDLDVATKALGGLYLQTSASPSSSRPNDVHSQPHHPQGQGQGQQRYRGHPPPQSAGGNAMRHPPHHLHTQQMQQNPPPPRMSQPPQHYRQPQQQQAYYPNPSQYGDPIGGLGGLGGGFMPGFDPIGPYGGNPDPLMSPPLSYYLPSQSSQPQPLLPQHHLQPPQDFYGSAPLDMMGALGGAGVGGAGMMGLNQTRRDGGVYPLGAPPSDQYPLLQSTPSMLMQQQQLASPFNARQQQPQQMMMRSEGMAGMGHPYDRGMMMNGGGSNGARYDDRDPRSLMSGRRDDRGQGGHHHHNGRPLTGAGAGAGRDRDARNNFHDSRRGGNNNHHHHSSNGSSGNGGGGPIRDVLVEEFRNTYGKSKSWEIRDLVGHVVAFCQDQHGSRFIQQRLEVASDDEKQLIFDEILLAADSLMTDVFGNYVIQKLFEYGTPSQCESLAALLAGQSIGLAMQMYGCRVIQKALEYVCTQRLIILVAEFDTPQVASYSYPSLFLN